MNTNEIFYGFDYENHAKSLFRSLGYKVLKMGADFEFDLFVTTHEVSTFTEMINKNYSVFQIKVGKVNNWRYIEHTTGTRRCGIANFSFSNEDLKKLIYEPNAYIICYMVDGERYDSIVGYFWLNSNHLKYLSEEKNPKYNSKWTWFNEHNNGNLVLRAKIILEVNLEEQYNDLLLNLREIIDSKIPKWSTDYNDFNSIYKVLQRLVEKSYIGNKNSNSIIELVASTKKSGEFGSSLQLVKELLNISNFNQRYGASPFVYTR